MKKKITKYSLFGTILVFLVLWSCQQDDFYNENQNSSKQEIKLKRVSLDDIMNKPEHKRFKQPFMEFKEHISLKSNPNIQGKLVYNEEFGLYIDDENGVFIEKEDYQSYTFRIERPESDGKIENIVFGSNSNGDFDIKIIIYDITYEEIENLGAEDIMTRAVEYFSYNNYQVEMLPGLICIESWTTYGDGVVSNNNGEVVPNTPLFTSTGGVLNIDCSWDTSAGTGSSSGWTGNGNWQTPSNGNQNGSGGANTNGGGKNVSTIVTTLVGMDGVVLQNDCVELKKLQEEDKQNINPVIEELKDIVSTPLNYENGYQFEKNANGERINTEIPPTTDSLNSIPVKSGGDNIGAIHTHTAWLYPMFSFADLWVLYKLHKGAPQDSKQEVSFMLVAKECATCTQINVYALKVSDIRKFSIKLQSFLTTPETMSFTEAKKHENANRRFNDMIQQYSLTDTQNLEKVFLEFLEDSGVSLYKADDDLSNWSKLGLSSNPLLPVKQTPCN